MTTIHERAVLFLDLLGFSRLTENNPLDVEALRRAQHPLAGMLDQIIAARQNPLIRVFTSFHHTLKWAIEIAQLKHPVTAITFSDSAFIATDKLSHCVDIATSILQSLVAAEVPARAGIAYGSFSAVRFRSDIVGDTGDHSAHFLGTGVVRSHAAESCGIKGFRILLHPSALPLLERENGNSSSSTQICCLPCSPEECTNTQDIRFEINYWQLKPTAELRAWRAFQDMWDAAPEGALPHYEATAKAIDRMRMSQGKQGLVDLRRRALPPRSKEQPKPVPIEDPKH